MTATPVAIMGGMGRMGATLVRLAGEDPGLKVVGVLERKERLEDLKVACADCLVGSLEGNVLAKIPGAVVIDFTSPESTLKLAETARASGNPLVIGTTGLSAGQQEQLADAARDIPIFWAPNMSVGVNVLLDILPRLSDMLGPAYDIEIVETHHRHKKDAPSGTAVKLSQILCQAREWDPEQAVRACREGIIGARPDQEIGVQTLRGGDVVGEHTVFFFGPGERIEVIHRAHSRETFAQGALRAAKWLAGQGSGKLYTMADMVAAH